LLFLFWFTFLNKVKEQSVENLIKGNNKFEPPRFMSVATAVRQLMKMEAEFGGGVCGPQARAIGLARVGHETQVCFCFCFCVIVSFYPKKKKKKKIAVDFVGYFARIGRLRFGRSFAFAGSRWGLAS
jgi:hypothetical protein